MELVGIVRCPVDALLPYGEGRQIDLDTVKRLWKYFEKTERNPSDERNHIRGIVTSDDLKSILSTLGLSERGLKSTTQQDEYPLLSGHRIACLNGRHRLRAMTQHKPLSWWVVRLYCVQGNWLRFPLQLSSTSAIRQRIQDEVEHTSHETRYSDAEIYRLIRKYMRAKDNRRELECRERLTPCRLISLKGLLKRSQLVEDLDSLDKFPGVIGGLQLSNVHKHLALHIDEQISHYLRHILKVWNDITGDDTRVTICVDLETVKCLQFRAPSTSDVDRLAIKRMFSDGTLFRELRDLDLRDAVQDRVLSAPDIIPSLQTFHENMKYISLGARFLRNYFITPLQDKKLGTPTLFQRLAGDWSDPGAYYVEVADKKLEAVPAGRATAYRAYKHLFISALRHFARLTANSPRQDVRGETMPSFPENSRIRYLARLAGSLGFDNAKIQEALNNEDGHPSISDYVPEAGTPADWRGGIPFTKTYLSLQSLAFPPQLDNYVTLGKSPSPLFVMQDIINAFFEKTDSLGPGSRPRFPDEGGQPADEEDLYSATDNEGDVTMRGPLDARVESQEEDRAVNRRSRSNVLGPRSSRISKGRRRSRHGRTSKLPSPADGETIFRQLHRSPQLFSEDEEAWLRASTPTGGENRSQERISHQPSVWSSIPGTEISPTLREPQAARQPPQEAHPGEPSTYRPVSGTLPDDFTTAEDPETWREPQAAREPREIDRSVSQAAEDASVKGEASSEYETVGSRRSKADILTEATPVDPITLRQPQAAKKPEGMTHPLGRVSANSSVRSESLSEHEAVGGLGQTRMDQAERPAQSDAPPKSPTTLREPRAARKAPSPSASTIEQGSAIREHPELAELAQPDTLRGHQIRKPYQATVEPTEDVASENAPLRQHQTAGAGSQEGRASGSYSPYGESLPSEALMTARELPIEEPQEDQGVQSLSGASPHIRERQYIWSPTGTLMRGEPTTRPPIWLPANVERRNSLAMSGLPSTEEARSSKKRKPEDRMSRYIRWPWPSLFPGSSPREDAPDQPIAANQENATAVEGVATLNFDTAPPPPALRPIPPIRRMKSQRRTQRRPRRQVPVRARISLISQGSRSQYSQDSQLSQSSLPSQYSQNSDHHSLSTGVGPPPPKRPRLDDDDDN